MASNKLFLMLTLAAVCFSAVSAAGNRRLLATTFPGIPDPSTTAPGFQGTTEPGSSYPSSTFPGGFGSTAFPGGFPGSFSSAGFPGSLFPGFASPLFNPQFGPPFFGRFAQPNNGIPTGYPGGAPAYAGAGTGPYGSFNNPPQIPNVP